MRAIPVRPFDPTRDDLAYSAESIPAYATVGYSLEAQTKASERYERNKREVKRTDLGEHVPIVQP